MTSNRCSMCPKRKDNCLCQGCQIFFCVKHFNKHQQERQSSLPYSLRSLSRCRGSLSKKRSSIKPIHDASQKQQQMKRLNKRTVKNDLNRHPCADKTKEREPARHYRILSTSQWAENGIQVAGALSAGDGLNQLLHPRGLFVDDYKTLFIADCGNNRVMEWKSEATSGQTMIGQHGQGTQNDCLMEPTDVIVDTTTNSLIVCDLANRRVMRWPREDGSTGQTIISKIHSYNLAMDDDGFLYTSNYSKHEVRRWHIGDAQGILVAGGNRRGDCLDQLYNPANIFIDRDHSVYVSDLGNNRVMKWMKGAKEGIVVAGGQGEGSALTQLSRPRGLFVDHLDNVYVVDRNNHRIMRWTKGATQGSVIVGGNGPGRQANELNYPTALSFDLDGNLYVADLKNHRIQRFSINDN